ncbi:4Fe-4S binding protein [Methylonatrum kenyense]|uniref:4Fe-4S binding protein n=1 Tax=Methylonatrum kenyense TaxID=455253 RepID=UPI0020C0EF3A|nr:4Fe-4S binding protein [Methylonatrum kenyense]MCK8514808.1 4Fe-4S binding protein [Methylonatrum kenyense]
MSEQTHHGLPVPAVAARDAALAAVMQLDNEATAVVEYRSAGSLLLLGPGAAVATVLSRLPSGLQCTVLVSDGTAVDVPERMSLVSAHPVQLSGHLGHFDVRIQRQQGEPMWLAELLGGETRAFDLVLDLHAEPLIDVETLPFGYYAPRDDSARLERALAEIPEMTGDFEKPRYFNYNPDICAHGDSGLNGCTRCLDACPTGAIVSLGERVEVDPYWCQGGGSCAAACPTGAMIYAYPTPKDQLRRIRMLLDAYREAGGDKPVLLFVDEEAGLQALEAAAENLPDSVLPVPVAEVGAIGMDIWLASLAYGATAVTWLETDELAASVQRELADQKRFVEPILAALGFQPTQLSALTPDTLSGIDSLAGPAVADVARFDTFNDKRGSLRLAIDHLREQAADVPDSVGLVAGAPFGQVLVDSNACTLCMACPQVCPTNALSDAGDKPQLNFTEDLCVQCGLCQTACPEDAITLEARYLFDWEVRRKPQVANEEAPFNCIVCGTPFATASVIERMTERLGDHHMFQSEASLRRLKMCGDCRVTDLFSDDMTDVSKPTVYGMKSS